jgi:beta-mannosidase
MSRAAYYAIARELRPYTVGMARKDIKKFDDESTGAFFTINQELQLWACNSTLQEKKAKIELVSFDLDGGEVDRQSFGGKLAPNASTEIWKGDVPGELFEAVSERAELMIRSTGQEDGCRNPQTHCCTS